MKEKDILTVRELAEYIRIHERTAVIPDDQSDYLKFMADGQWQFELASVDHYLQQKFLESSNEDLDLIISSNNQKTLLSKITDETSINMDFQASNRNKALSNLAKMASLIRIASSYEELYLELESREKLHSTAIGNGVAIPHSRFPHQMIYKMPRLIIARSTAGVDFSPSDHQRIHLFFMPCAPTQFIHLRMMAQIAKLLHSPNFIEKMKKAKNKNEILSIIREFEERQ